MNKLTRNDPLGEFVCRFPNCDARYRRKEHLRRHEAKHIQDRTFPCSICGQEFGRNACLLFCRLITRLSDTLRRHLRVKHQLNEPVHRARRACANCRAIKARCEGKPVCTECQHRGIRCSLGEGEDSPAPEPRRSVSPRPTVSREEQFVKLFFELFHPHWPFVHRGTFRVRHEIPMLVQSMVVLGLWASGERSARCAAVELHEQLNSAILQQKEKWDASNDTYIPHSGSWPIPIYQAILLHIIFSLIYKTHGSLGLDLKPSVLRTDTELLLKTLIQSCRNRGMFYYPRILRQYQEPAIAQYMLVSIEEVKRFNMALYKVCTTIYGSTALSQTVDGVSMSSILLTADELQFPLPENHALWEAATQDAWDRALADMNVDGLDDFREEDWISKHSRVLHVLGNI
ncbi:C2H2 type zinc finger domain protein [Aspergillus sclerotiicarbonarius CBS 121057]|uniref:C2H2 type zinc finger domain protein n=1 Tax=Aspergillus sclerotiicarbonarius (strain CBS 121057 / IBT 28362) TaxID=1448318 RepID=A0A319DWQ4_ASPSB|nr:C2H2 type zinc finger domain protein [Aspergillus sclerotiicarbonarius CBS 121057]